MLLVCRYGPEEIVEPEGDFLARARHAVGLLARQPGCERVEFGRAVEAPGEWVLVAVFASLTDYRRALSPFDVREHVVPFLAAARTDEPATFERRLSASGPAGDDGPAPAEDGVVDHPSILD
ncbi:antibiotic biosynthesis monooxygenase [Actinomycetospora endophytica]|uniref:Antibiotic biosynthesis monooxygenase n=1 Tax=Actinomycetospora endophytica TaxID=2291215 RepID=A0ABS8PH79_9PSEU|nr:antibiotic biosynthesis monooxygenase family protein [Actinomycetospora endophytica]MCD2196344.1 antibiotic biosynthesis monooxygenase [Actinomycetospora endophytica]